MISFKKATISRSLSRFACVDGRQYLNFCGSGYLAMSDLPQLRDAARAQLASGAPFNQQARPAWGFEDPPFAQLQNCAAAFLEREASVYFGSGYLIGIVGLTAFDLTSAHIFIDQNAHHCLRSAVQLAARPTTEYRHCDAADLGEKIASCLEPNQWPLIVSDGMFATAGAIPPLRQYGEIIAPLGGRMFIDESHALGVVGKNGRGACEFHGVEQLAIVGATLSKAMCAQGAVVACSELEAKRMRGSPAIVGSNAGSPLSAAVATAALRYAREHPERRMRVTMLAEKLRKMLRTIGMETMQTPGAVVSFVVGDGAAMARLRDDFFAQGILVYHSRYIGAGTGGIIRCSIFADHEEQDLKRLITALIPYGSKVT